MADCGDAPRMSRILDIHRPEVVLHVAAHKHVPMMESNPGEAVKNNVLGTRTMGELSAHAGVGTFVLISTDKAVKPKSIMGASKRVAEMVIQDLNRRHDTCFTAVRFGNVLGSTGSVIPIFNEQISRGGPVTVTDERMRRYFMSISEAAQLVLTAATYSEGGEIFILDMGEPVPIVKLAEKLITLSGFEPYQDIDIVFTGARPGEKMFEELGTEAERLTPTANAKIFIATSSEDVTGVARALDRLQTLVELNADADRFRDAFAEAIPDAKLGSGVDSLQ
jgi:FlaA1/EpsC-like NDP-sugar epimerase